MFLDSTCQKKTRKQTYIFWKFTARLRVARFWGLQKQCATCVSARSVYLKAVNLKTLKRAENVLKNDNVIEKFSSVYQFYIQFIDGELTKLYSFQVELWVLDYFS